MSHCIIPEICAQIDVSDRTLRLHCHEHLGMSPHRLRRMNLARRTLLGRRQRENRDGDRQ
jgi:AraC-like DNA-binding protein